MFRVCVRRWWGLASGPAWRRRFAPPGECVRRGPTVSVRDSSFADLEANCIKADGQHFIPGS